MTKLKTKSYCQVCRKNHPQWLVRDLMGNQVRLCGTCRGLFTTQAVLAEMRLQTEHFERQLSNYLSYIDKYNDPRVVRKASLSFEESFQTRINRLSQIASKKRFGRESKKVNFREFQQEAGSGGKLKAVKLPKPKKKAKKKKKKSRYQFKKPKDPQTWQTKSKKAKPKNSPSSKKGS